MYTVYCLNMVCCLFFQIANLFLEEANLHRRQVNLSPLPWKDAVKFCMARKFDKERALELQKHNEVIC